MLSTEAAVVVGLPRERMASGVALIMIQRGTQRVVYRLIAGVSEHGIFSNTTSLSDPRGLARALSAYEISAASPGYISCSFPQSGPVASGLTLTLTRQESDSLEQFRPYYEGIGVIRNLADGKLVHLPIEKRIHVIIFPEGYTAADLNARRYETDLATWYSQVFRVAPMDFFREAFVIWKYPVASRAHIIPDGTSDTYFGIRVVSGSVSSSLDSCRARMWRIISTTFPYRSGLVYYPSGGITGQNAKNMTVSFMVYDAQQQRSGYSGIATTLSNPANTAQRIATAFSRGHQHEFMHAMAKLGDEYYDLGHSPASLTTLRQESAYITNVVASNKCDSLPWKHLFYGGQFNPGVDSLVGAFGANGRYHPELKCLMNGSHNNSVLFGGSNNLRTDDRLCNWCREIVAFRIYERSMMLDNNTTSWNTWVSSYRPAFYQTIGFNKPSVVPQRNSLGTPWFMPCSR